MVERFPSPEAELYFQPGLIDKPQDECGIAVVNTPGLNAGEVACRAICELSNRGYEATGMGVVSETAQGGSNIYISKGFGKGRVVFPDGGKSFSDAYPAHQAGAQSRYSTQGTSELDAAQPHGFEVQTGGEPIHFAHVVNGNLQNTEELAVSLGCKPGEYSSDSEIAGRIIADTMRWLSEVEPNQHTSLREVMLHTLPRFRGSFMGAVMMEGETVVYCDPHGLKPAVIGILPDQGILVASEVTALDANNARLVREVKPGELITINTDGSEWKAEQWTAPQPGGCLVELMYVMKTHGTKPDGTIGTKAVFRGVEVLQARRDAGYALAEVAPVGADYVCGLPNSAIPAGEGYAESSGITYMQFIAARDLDKSFIAPTQEQRIAMVRKKIYVPDDMQAAIKGKSLVVAEDSMIRGTTLKEVVSILREHEPAEIHARIALDRIRFICDLGVDMADTGQLLAANMDDKTIADLLGLDSLAFLPIEKIESEVLKEHKDDFCKGCMTGVYPTDLGELNEPSLIQLTKKPSLTTR